MAINVRHLPLLLYFIFSSIGLFPSDINQELDKNIVFNIHSRENYGAVTGTATGTITSSPTVTPTASKTIAPLPDIELIFPPTETHIPTLTKTPVPTSTSTFIVTDSVIVEFVKSDYIPQFGLLIFFSAFWIVLAGGIFIILKKYIIG